MRLNEKNVASFAVCSSPVDKEGYLQKKGDLNKEFLRRWFVLKGNLLFYFLKKQDREPQGVIVLEACSVQVSIHGRYCFEISFDGAGTRVYVLGADNDADMQLWMKVISHASYQYLKSIVDELQRRVNVLSSSSAPQKEADKMEVMNVGPVAASTGPSRAKTTKETKVTLQELSNPIAPHGRSPRNAVKVKKGILVDVSDDEAPPLPAKKKSLTMHSSHRVASGQSTYIDKLLAQGDSDTTQVDGGLQPDPTSSSHAPLTLVKSLDFPSTRPSPFSSPLVPAIPIENSSKPLSPPATLDRTPVLQPSPVKTSPAKATSTNTQAVDVMIKLSLIESDSQSLHNGEMERVSEQLPSTEPSSHPPQVPRKLAAPLDPSKSFIEMHEDFNQAMKALNAERTASNKPLS